MALGTLGSVYVIVHAVNSATAGAFDRRQANVYWLAVAVTVLVLFMSVVLARVLRKGARVLRIGAQDTQRTYTVQTTSTPNYCS